jgi:hypothetical protein
LHPEENAEESTPAAKPVEEAPKATPAAKPASYALNAKKNTSIDEEFDELFK